jgi:hypothetical protein
VGIEAFDASKGLNEWQRIFKRLLVHAHNARTALELVGAQA